MSDPASRRALIGGYLAIFLLTLTGIEVTAFLFGRAYLLVRVPFLLYAAPRIDRPTWDRYLAVRDPHLGWPNREALRGDAYDSSGARPLPAFPVPGDECISLYGDSYTYGAEVSHAEAWGNVLARRTGCRVGNFGVGGYGTDQAVLRFATNDGDSAAVSILGLFPINMLRNVNQYRHLRTGESPLGLKPRFIVAGDSLQLVPLPELTFAQTKRLANDPAVLLPHEVFLPGTDLGPVRFAFPFGLALGRLALHPQVRNWVSEQPSWIDYLKPDHSSGALEVTARLCRRFVKACQRRGKSGFVVLLPTPSSFDFYVEHGKLVMEPLVTRLEATDVPYLALTPRFAERLRDEHFAAVITNWPRPGMGHLNPRGNAMVAGFVMEYLEGSRLVGDL